MNYLLEIIVILLLGMTVMFCWRLNSKITEIKSSRKDMASLVKVFDEAIINTNNSLGALKEASANAAVDLKKYTIKSNELISELAFMNDTTVRLADRLENVLFEAKDIETRCLSLLEKAAAIKKPTKRKARKKVTKNEEKKVTPLKLRDKKVKEDINETIYSSLAKKKIVNRK
ncbi:MAG: DUF6468 domain-containing protein [Candidatus Midichloria sp.]|nr:hypothetical protein MHYMCMPSP_00533 [Hyalomma marginatum]